MALTSLVRRYPLLRPAVDEADLRSRESILIRGLHELPVVAVRAPAVRRRADSVDRLCCAPLGT
ncbi:hypothetical protein [Nocardia barduliensis]|uniref:hypothetical protein n=1 Tax=Nocardia barduliensis TaxID=2736643 RepID=UPI00157354F3|nr:hypothetical protein [Nocardia barduliensis]